MFSIADKDGTIFSADSAEKTVELYRAFHGERDDGWIEWHGGWIEWHGGECPVADGTKVSVRFRSGVECTDDNSELLCWEHQFGNADIVAYKVVENA